MTARGPVSLPCLADSSGGRSGPAQLGPEPLQAEGFRKLVVAAVQQAWESALIATPPGRMSDSRPSHYPRKRLAEPAESGGGQKPTALRGPLSSLRSAHQWPVAPGCHCSSAKRVVFNYALHPPQFSKPFCPEHRHGDETLVWG